MSFVISPSRFFKIDAPQSDAEAKILMTQKILPFAYPIAKLQHARRRVVAERRTNLACVSCESRY